jgi:hypothetical protein
VVVEEPDTILPAAGNAGPAGGGGGVDPRDEGINVTASTFREAAELLEEVSAEAAPIRELTLRFVRGRDRQDTRHFGRFVEALRRGARAVRDVVFAGVDFRRGNLMTEAEAARFFGEGPACPPHS